MPERSGWNSERVRRLRDVKRVLLAQAAECYYCGWPLSIDNATIDHVVPTSAGGGDEPANLVLACRRCNLRKSAFPVWALAVSRHRGAGMVLVMRTPGIRERLRCDLAAQ